MSQVHPELIDDMVLSVIDDHYKFKGFGDLASLFPDSVVAGKWFDRMKAKGGSHTVTFRLKVRNVGNPRFDVGLYDIDQPSRDDQFVEGKVRYTGINTGIHYDIEEESFMNPSAAVKLDYIKEINHSAWQRLMLELGCRMFAYPTAATDKGILGIPYWVSKSAATAAEDFSHDNATAVYGDDIVGDVNQETYKAWKNGTGVFDTFASREGLKLLSEAMDKCHFRTNSMTLGSPDDRGLPTYTLFTTYENHQAYEDYVYNQNDNIGADAGAYRGSQVYRSTPLIYLWELDQAEYEDGRANPAQSLNTDNPVYGINWDTFQCLTKNGGDFRVTGPRPAPNQRDVRRIDWDKRCQNVCINRRKNFRLHKAA